MCKSDASEDTSPNSKDNCDFLPWWGNTSKGGKSNALLFYIQDESMRQISQSLLCFIS